MSGYVLLAYNRASGVPRVMSYSGYNGGDIEHSLKDAEELLDIVRREASKGWHAPAEQFAIAELRRITEPAPAYNQDTKGDD